LTAAGSNAADDKQELERQRLLAEASSPPEFPSDWESEAGPSSASAPPLVAFQPSAPVLSEEDEYGASFAYHGMGGSSSRVQSLSAEPLPKYER
jgi:hypothetical protein